MSLVNIPRYCEDPNYRYKMPRIQSRIEGRGNGMKTNISNMGDIARALKRPPTYATKFFGCELGAMSKFEESEEKALINGAHNEKVLTLILDKFIEMYVLCPECHLPEIEVIVRKGALFCRCNACGYKGVLDMTHKAASYMVKNPTNTTDLSRHNQRSGANGNGLKKDTGSSKDNAIRKRTKKKHNADDNNVLVDPAKVGTTENEKMTIDSEELMEIVDRLFCFLESEKCPSPSDFSEELHMLQISQGFDNLCRFYVVLCAIFYRDFNTDLLEERISLVKAAASYAIQPKDMLMALAVFVVKKYPNQLTEYPYICRSLYANDVIEGSDIVKFYSKSSRFSGIMAQAYMQTREVAAPFVEWLQEDEDDD